MNREIFIERLTNDFNICTDLTDINFVKVDIQPYNWVENEQCFGEKLCLLYTAEFIIFNIKFTMKILSFVYPDHAELLKLEIIIHNKLLEKELASCRNFLQRKRNLSLALEVLLKIGRLYESRRLICQTILEKENYLGLILNFNAETGINIVCNDRQTTKTKYFECNWKIDWNLDTYEVNDYIEFYCNKSDKECGKKMKNKMKLLVQPDLIFNQKVKLWKLLIEDINFHRNKMQQQNDKKDLIYCEISDDSSDDNNILKTEVKNSDNIRSNNIVIID